MKLPVPRLPKSPRYLIRKQEEQEHPAQALQRRSNWMHCTFCDKSWDLAEDCPPACSDEPFEAEEIAPAFCADDSYDWTTPTGWSIAVILGYVVLCFLEVKWNMVSSVTNYLK